MTSKIISCSLCGKPFYRRLRQVNEALKFEWKQYCSKECLAKDKTKSVKKVCATCAKKINRIPSQLRKSKSGQSFCSQACAAIFNNKVRNSKKPVHVCKARGCNKKIPSWNLYCSRVCAALMRKRDKGDIAREVMGKLKKFEHQAGRIPIKKEMYDLYGKARTAFGTWNNAIEAAGFKPNPVMFAKKYLASDGHKCDSLAEKIVDEWLHSKGISHERSVPYPEFERMTCDFVVNDFYIEFFGLEGEHRGYTKLVNKKRRLSKKYGIKLIEIKPSHLFPKNKLNQILNFLT